MPGETERKVYFYRAHTGQNDDGTIQSYDPSPAFDHLSELDFDENGRYWDMGDGELLCGWPDSTPTRQRIRLGKVRRSNLPPIDRGGELEPLDLDAKEGIVEQTHVAFFDNDIAGLLYNHYGPRMGGLKNYLWKKYEETPRKLKFSPLLRQDVLEQLDRLSEIRILTLSIQRPFLRRMQEAEPHLAATLESQMDRVGADQVEVHYKPEKYTERSISDDVFGMVRNIVDLFTDGPDGEAAREEVNKFKIKALDPQSDSPELIDLLHDQLVVSRRVEFATDRSGYLDRESAYGAIESAYEDLEEQLAEAAHAVPEQ